MATDNSTKEQSGDRATATMAVLRRKFGAARGGDPSVMTPAKALRIALSKAAEEGLTLAATVLGVEEKRLARDPFLETIEDDRLLLVLEGPEGAKGLVVPDPEFLAAIIEVQTLGRVMSAPAAPRAPTAIDAAICHDFLDLALGKFAQELAELPAARWAGGYRYGLQVANTRLLGLMLEDVPYRVFRISLDLASGTRRGTLVLALPIRPLINADGSVGQDRGAVWRHAMKARVMDSETQLHAVLQRLTMPLDQVCRLKVGELLTMPLSVVANVSLETTETEGEIQALAGGRLGQRNGFRAVCVSGVKSAGSDSGRAMSDSAGTPDGMAPDASGLAAAPTAGRSQGPDRSAMEVENPAALDAFSGPLEGAEPLDTVPGQVAEPMAEMPMDVDIG